ncbi:MAG: hypothetical protein CML05_14255 [Pseudozobellia sp.]|nr:hypothetical protein [Pseudozobellia sp.]|tara:strand:- start:370632 stop:371297 length:666 start_codon:yes stop_codon:yes gene_type:complete
MPSFSDNFENNSSGGYNIDLRLEGIESFRKSLEKYFFSEATVRNCTNNNNGVNLAVELECNLSLVEMLFHFNRGTWGNFKQNSSSFVAILDKFRKENLITVDIDELSILFKDTRIIINKIYSRSIAEQLDNILREMGKHYVHFSKGLSETPYEIYVPVFEEEHTATDKILFRNVEVSNHCKKDYFNFWGLYFESEDDAVIYDLNASHLENGDLFMLSTDED